MKLIMESWKRYLKEEISQEEQKIKTLMGEFADDDEFINQAIELAIIKDIDYFKYLPWRYKKAKLRCCQMFFNHLIYCYACNINKGRHSNLTFSFAIKIKTGLRLQSICALHLL